MLRNELYRVTDTRDNTTREGYYVGSGDWGMRFSWNLDSYRGFQIDDYLMDFFLIEEVDL